MKYCIKYLLLVTVIHFVLCPGIWARDLPLEKSVFQQLHKATAASGGINGRCDVPGKYIVYLIDNFDQNISVVPSLEISHGELMYAMLVSGRDDIVVKTLNTTLNNGLATVLSELLNGGCADGVISSIPGSNYSYRQVNSFLRDDIVLDDGNILEHRADLLELMLSIALHGFPSLEWLMRADVNPIKLREDARKIFFIEKLGEMGISVLLPYGNVDGHHRGHERNINLLGLSRYSLIYSAKGYEGKPLPGFPYSPLSSGLEIAQYQVVECPDYRDAHRVVVDVNDDGYSDFVYLRDGAIPYYGEDGSLSHSPPLVTELEFREILNEAAENSHGISTREVVLTLAQYEQLILSYPQGAEGIMVEEVKDFIWFNSSKHGRTISFHSQCEQKGEIIGTSLIPPMKIKELLPRKGRIDIGRKHTREDRS